MASPELDNPHVHLSAIRRALADDEFHIPASLPNDCGETAVIEILASIDANRREVAL